MNVDLARWQFAFVTINHFFFVPVTIGLAFLTAVLQTTWYRTNRDEYLRLTRFFGGYSKVLLAALVTGTMVMLAVSAWQLRRGQDKDKDVFLRSARLSVVVLVPAILFTMLVGDELGVIEARYQPMKIAAAEAQWTTCQPCSFSLFQIGGGNNDHTPTQILAIPHLLSLLATNHWNGQVVGLSPLQSQYSKQFGPGYYVPDVFIQYWSMRVMAYAGVLVLLV